MQSIDERLRTYMPFFGTWELQDPPELLGRGSSGTVYRIWNQSPSGMLDAALKVIPIPKDDAQLNKWLQEAGGSEAGLRQRIKEEFEYVQAEIQTLETLKADSHIVCFENYMIYKRNDTPLGWDVLIRMERLVTLKNFLDHIDRYPHKRDLRLVLTIWDELLSGLCLCERNHVLHLDIKPENIFYAEPGKDYFKLGDFGVSIRNEKDKIVGKGTRVGTIDYMSPEMYNFQGSDSRSDMYSLAIVIYELLNGGRLPFMAPSEAINPKTRYDASMRRLSGKESIRPIKGVDGKLMQVILKCLSFDPNDRYPNMQQMQAALRAYMYGAPSGEKEKKEKKDKQGKKEEGGKSLKKLYISIGVVGALGLIAFGVTQMLPKKPPVDAGDGGEGRPPVVTAGTPTVGIVSVAPETPPPTEPAATPTPVVETPSPTSTLAAAPASVEEGEPQEHGTDGGAEDVEPEALEFAVESELTEDQTKLVLRSNRDVDVDLYYFRRGEAVEVSPEYKAQAFKLNGAYEIDLSKIGMTLTEGDVCLLIYEDDAGEEQRVSVEVGPSQRAQMRLEVENLISVEGQALPVLKGGILNATIIGEAKDFATWTWYTEDMDESDGTSDQMDAQGRLSFDLTGNACGIDEAGMVITLSASYSNGLSASKWCSMDILWTTDEEAELRVRPVMEGDTGITVETEPDATVTVLLNGEPVGGSAKADADGLCAWQGDVAFAPDDVVTVHVTDVFGNEGDAAAPVTGYGARIDNLIDGEVMGNTATISGIARPGATLRVRYLDGAGEPLAVAEDIQADAVDGAYTVDIDADFLADAVSSVSQCAFEVGNDADGYIATEPFDWQLRVRLQLAEALTEDSPALRVETEPGATVSVASGGVELYTAQAESDGSWNYVPEADFVLGASYTLTAVDPNPDYQSRTNALAVAVAEADRAAIEANVTNTVELPDRALPVVKGGEMVIEGTAEPNREVTARWAADTPVEASAQADGDGRFTVRLDAGDSVPMRGASAKVRLFYADGKAAGAAYESDLLTWTIDESVTLTVDSLMDYSNRIVVHTDANATVTISRDGEELVSGNATMQGRFTWTAESALVAGDVYHIECEDTFGNTSAVDATVLHFSARVEGAEDGALKRDRASLSGVAQPDMPLAVSLVVNGETYPLQDDLSTDGTGAYSVTYAYEALAPYGVDGSRVSFVVECGGERIETPEFDWNYSVPLRLAQEALDEDSESLDIESEAGARLTIVRVGLDGSEQTVYQGELDAEGGYRYLPEDFFVGNYSYRVTVEDPDDATRPASSRTVAVYEVDRANIDMNVSGLQSVEGKGFEVVKGAQMAVSGYAEPNAQLLVQWYRFNGDNDYDYVTGVEVTAAQDGTYSAQLDAEGVVGPEGDRGYVVAFYADGKAGSRANFSDYMIWTIDDQLALEAAALTEGDTSLFVSTDANARVTVTLDGGRVSGEDATADAEGGYVLDFGASVTVGSVYRVEATDAFGNAASIDVPVAADPYAPIALSVDPPVYINAATEALTISGTAELNTQLYLYLNDNQYALTTSPDGEFSWSESVGNLGALLDGDIRIWVGYATGHVFRSSEAVTLRVDRTIPTLETDLDGLSARSTQITGTTELGATVALRINGEERGVMTCENTTTFAFNDIALNENDVVELQAWDAAGNYSEPMQTVIGKQEAARIYADLRGNDLYVSGWIVCDELSAMALEVGGIYKPVMSYTQVGPGELSVELATYESETGVHVNTVNKQCVRIDEQVIDVGKLDMGNYELQLIVDDFSDTRQLASVNFEKQTNAMVAPNTPAMDEENPTFVVGLDDVQAMNGNGLLLTGWYYGTSANDTYIISEARVVETYAEADTNAASEIIIQTEELPSQPLLGGDLQQGYAKVTRLNVAASCPENYRAAVGEIAPVESNAGFMIWLDSWGELPDGDYKVAVVVICGGKMYYPSTQLTIRNGEPVVYATRLQLIAEEWNPLLVEEPALDENAGY